MDENSLGEKFLVEKIIGVPRARLEVDASSVNMRLSLETFEE